MNRFYGKYLITLLLMTISLANTNSVFSMELEPSPEILSEDEKGIGCANIDQLKQNIIEKLNFYCEEIKRLESTEEIQSVKTDALHFSRNELPTILNTCSAIALDELYNFLDETINFQRDLEDPLILEEFKTNLINHPKLLEIILYLHLNPLTFTEGSLKEKALYSVFSNTLTTIRIANKANPIDTLPDYFYKQLSESPISELNTEMFEKDEILKEFTSLKLSDFVQNQYQGACILYSLLWGIHENKTLTQELIKNIRKDKDGNYYFNIPNSENVIIIPHKLVTFEQESFSRVKSYGSALHPSKKELIRAIGLYILKRMGDLALNERAYYVYDTNIPEEGDFLLGLPYRVFTAFGPHGGDTVRLMEDGSIIVDYIRTDDVTGNMIDRKREKLSGDFVLSVSGSKHARSIYYRKDIGKWYLFNNEVNVDKTGIPYQNNPRPLTIINDAIGKNLIGKTSNEIKLKFPYVRVFGNITTEPIND